MYRHSRSRVLVVLAALGVLILSLLTAPTVIAAPTECPRVLFIGVHGVNQGAAGDDPTEANWGPTIDDVWKRFSGHQGEAGDFPFVKVNWFSVRFLPQVLDLRGKADQYAATLKKQVVSEYRTCGSKTRIVLAGYSLGAWAIDKALRNLRDGSRVDRAALLTVSGVGLMGDPAFPEHMCTRRPHRSCRHGVATAWGRGYTPAAYVDNGRPNRFISLCLSYSNRLLDPVCGQYRNTDILFPANVDVHSNGYRSTRHNGSGAADRIADFLSSLTR